jgi:hypothetical protein
MCDIFFPDQKNKIQQSNLCSQIQLINFSFYNNSNSKNLN